MNRRDWLLVTVLIGLILLAVASCAPRDGGEVAGWIFVYVVCGFLMYMALVVASYHDLWQIAALAMFWPATLLIVIYKISSSVGKAFKNFVEEIDERG